MSIKRHSNFSYNPVFIVIVHCHNVGTGGVSNKCDVVVCGMGHGGSEGFVKQADVGRSW